MVDEMTAAEKAELAANIRTDLAAGWLTASFDVIALLAECERA